MCVCCASVPLQAYILGHTKTVYMGCFEIRIKASETGGPVVRTFSETLNVLTLDES